MDQLRLLNQIERKEHTHKIIIDMLKEDLSVKTIEIRFNGFDEWEESYPMPGNIAELILAKVCPLIIDDKKTLGYKATSYCIASGQIGINWLPVFLGPLNYKN